MISAIVTGEDSVKAELLATVEVIRARIAETLEEIGEETAFIAGGEAPRKSGNLASTMRARLRQQNTSMTEIVSPGKFYGFILAAGVANYGTRHNKSTGILRRTRRRISMQLKTSGQWRILPHPFLALAEDAMRGQVQERLQAATNAAIAEKR